MAITVVNSNLTIRPYHLRMYQPLFQLYTTHAWYMQLEHPIAHPEILCVLERAAHRPYVHMRMGRSRYRTLQRPDPGFFQGLFLKPQSNFAITHSNALM